MGQARSCAVLAGCMVGAWGCGEGSTPALGPSVVDSAGIRIVDHWQAVMSDRWSVDADGALTLEGDTDTPLFEIRGAVELADGGVAVADGGNHRIVFYDPVGAIRFTTGRQGEGPGEFQRLGLLAKGPADSLLVWDSQVRRVSVLAPTGEFTRSYSLETTDDVPFASVIAVYGDGSFLATGFVDTGGEPPGGGRRSYAVPSYHFSADGEFRAASGNYSTGESYFETVERGFSVFPALFASEAFRVPVQDQLLTATSDVYELRYRSRDGTTLMIVRREPRRRGISAEARSAMIDALVEDARQEQAERLEGVLTQQEVPEFLPELSEIFADRLGRVWVREFEVPEPASMTWIIYGGDGLQVGSLSLPARFEPSDAGVDFVLGVATDDFGVESVVRYALSR